MNKRELDPYLETVHYVLTQPTAKINKWREKFMLEVLLLYLIIMGKIHFLQPGR